MPFPAAAAAAIACADPAEHIHIASLSPSHLASHVCTWETCTMVLGQLIMCVYSINESRQLLNQGIYAACTVNPRCAQMTLHYVEGQLTRLVYVLQGE